MVARLRISRYESANGPVAQLDRASPSEGEGRAFESRRVRQSFSSGYVPDYGMIARVASLRRADREAVGNLGTANVGADNAGASAA
jgi:hypothetical protein